MRYIVHDTTTGEVIRTGNCPADDLAVINEAVSQVGQAAEELLDDAILADGLWTRAEDGTYFQAEPPPPPPPTVVELQAYAMRKVNALTGAMVEYTSNSTTIKSDCDQGTIADWMALQQWAMASPLSSKTWVANDYSTQELPAAEVGTISEMVGTRRAAIFAVLAGVLEAIVAETVTTTAEIDGAPWP